MKFLLILALFSTEVCNNTYKNIVSLVEAAGWVVTSTTGGRHNINSRHYKRKAVDVSVRFKTDLDVFLLTEAAEKVGFVVCDERKRPEGQRVWTGPHIHIYVPECEVQKKGEVLIPLQIN